MIKNNTLVIVRTYTAGVHYGTLSAREGKEVLLTNARRIWSWKGALSLNEIAMQGVDLPNSRISIPTDSILLTEAIEILTISSESNLPL
jgi:hypothetical protein